MYVPAALVRVYSPFPGYSVPLLIITRASSFVRGLKPVGATPSPDY